MYASHEEVVRAVNAVFVDVFEIEENKLKPEANLYADLGLDSIDAIDLAISFERKFKVKVDEGILRSIRTLEDVYRTVADFQQTLPGVAAT